MMIHYKNFLFAVLLFTSCQWSSSEIKNVNFSTDNKNWVSEFKDAINCHIQKRDIRDTLLIQFTDGIYPLSESLSFIGDSSLNTNAPIIIRGGDKTVFTGGITLDSRVLKPISDNTVRNRIINLNARNKILEYDLFKNGINDLGEIRCVGFSRPRETAPSQLYINGERMTLARYPNAGDPLLQKNRESVIPIRKIINPGQDKVVLPGGTRNEGGIPLERGEFVYDDDRVEKWAKTSDVWLDGIFCRDWSWSLNKINKIDTVGKTVRLDYPEKYDLTANHSFFFATNLLEEIDVPGEYFIDRDKGKLYFYPPGDFNLNTSTIELSGNSQTFLQLEGVQNVRIENIDFELGRFNAVEIEHCNNIEIVDCSFNNFGNSAIIVKGENIKITHCNIHSTGGTAIDLNGGDFETLKASNNEVRNCDISDWANNHRVYSSAVALDGVGCKVLNNKMHFSPHGAITLTGNNHLIEGNEFSHILLEFEDFGAFHSPLGKNQLTRGHIIRQNYFHDIGQIGERVFAIYVDEATSGWAIEKNLFYKLGSVGARVGAIMSNTCSYVPINNNLFLDCSQTFELSFHFSTWAKVRYNDYFKEIWEKQYSNIESIPDIYIDSYPELKTFLTEDRIYVNTNSFTNNTIGNFTLPLKHENYFFTRSDLENSDHLVKAEGNRKTKDKSLVEFLEKWNVSANREELKNEMPELLRKYLID